MNAAEEDIQPLNATAEEQAYYPPRFWWLKRLGCAAILLIAAVIGLRIWAGISIERRINAKIETYRSAGEPILPADFTGPRVRAEKNAAILLEKASMAVAWPLEIKSKHYDLRRSCYLADHMDEARLITEANTEALRLLRQARSLPDVDWRVQFTSPMSNWNLPASNWRQLANCAKICAEYYHHIGEDYEAIEITRDLVSLADRIETDCPCLISHLISLTAAACSGQIIEAIAPTLNIAAGVDALAPAYSSEPENSATKEQIRLLMAELLDETARRRGLKLGTCCERACSYDEYVTYSSDWFEDLVMKPVVGLDALDLMDYWDACVKASQADNFASTEAAFPEDYDINELDLIIRPLLITGSRAYRKSFELDFRQRSFSRMAAVALAMRMYELDTGHRPDDLTELVPQYIDEIPSDPFAAGGRPIGFAPDAPRPVLYCVGRDLLDDGGRYGTKKYVSIDYDEADVPFFLDGPSPICIVKQQSASQESQKTLQQQGDVATDQSQTQSEDSRE